VLAPASHEDLVAADLERAFVGLGFDNKDARWPDDDVVDVRAPRSWDLPVVKDSEAISFKGLEQAPGPGLPVSADLPRGDRVGVVKRADMTTTRANISTTAP
jgi:hypothetical protein